MSYLWKTADYDRGGIAHKLNGIAGPPKIFVLSHRLWSRIDWIRLEMAPYEWAFCLSAYAAPTQEAALATTTARRDAPRTGCNGHPFSRMRRAGPADTLKSKAYAP
ncbi:hypothetical protein BH11GEM2_BH11GEM2_35000 [soil metagenome]